MLQKPLETAGKIVESGELGPDSAIFSTFLRLGGAPDRRDWTRQTEEERRAPYSRTLADQGTLGSQLTSSKRAVVDAHVLLEGAHREKMKGEPRDRPEHPRARR